MFLIIYIKNYIFSGFKSQKYCIKKVKLIWNYVQTYIINNINNQWEFIMFNITQ